MVPPELSCEATESSCIRWKSGRGGQYRHRGPKWKWYSRWLCHAALQYHKDYDMALTRHHVIVTDQTTFGGVPYLTSLSDLDPDIDTEEKDFGYKPDLNRTQPVVRSPSDEDKERALNAYEHRMLQEYKSLFEIESKASGPLAVQLNGEKSLSSIRMPWTRR